MLRGYEASVYYVYTGRADHKDTVTYTMVLGKGCCGLAKEKALEKLGVCGNTFTKQHWRSFGVVCKST